MVQMVIDKMASHYSNNYNKYDICLSSTFLEYKYQICCIIYQKYHKYLRVDKMVALMADKMAEMRVSLTVEMWVALRVEIKVALTVEMMVERRVA
jgi:hypothetical protein